MFRAIHEIGKWRPGFTWLPDWLFHTNGVLNIDGYHITGAIFLWTLFYFGVIVNDKYSLKTMIGAYPILWTAYGAVFDVFYHVIFIKPQYMDYYNSFIMEFFRYIVEVFL